MPIGAIILWSILIGFVLVIYISKIVGKIKYKNCDMEIDYDWLEKSKSRYEFYDNDETTKQYFFHPDKSFFHQGYLMEDRNHKVVYEAKFLYNNFTKADEVDFINHIIKYTSHHKVGHTVTSSSGFNNVSVTENSYFKFDGIDVFDYLNDLGYTHRFNLHERLAYNVEIFKDGTQIGTLYSSNNGKNYFNCDTNIVPKMSGPGYVVLETTLEHLDAVFVYSIAMARTELSSRSLVGMVDNSKFIGKLR